MFDYGTFYEQSMRKQADAMVNLGMACKAMSSEVAELKSSMPQMVSDAAACYSLGAEKQKKIRVS